MFNFYAANEKEHNENQFRSLCSLSAVLTALLSTTYLVKIYGLCELAKNEFGNMRTPLEYTFQSYLYNVIPSDHSYVTLLHLQEELTGSFVDR